MSARQRWWTRMLIVCVAGAALMTWNVTADAGWQRLLSAFLIAWFSAFEALTRPQKEGRE